MFYTQDTPTDRLPMLRQNVLRHGYAPCFVQPAFPLGWASTARQVLKEYAQPPAGADLRMMHDHRVMEHLPWLYHWYCEAAILHACIAFSVSSTYPASLFFAHIQGEQAPGQALDPLYSSDRRGLLSGILFLDTLPKEAGGHLLLYPPGKPDASIPPQEGLFVLFAKEVAATFTPLASGFSLSFASLDYAYRLPPEGRVFL